MDEFIKIGEILANPVVAGLIFMIVVIPAFWGIFNLLEWIKNRDIKKEKNHIAGKDKI